MYMRIGAALAIVLGLWAGYAKVKDIGYQEASTKYEQQIKEYQTEVANRIKAIETSSQALVLETRTNNEVLTKNVSNIVYGLKGKNLVIIKDGVCTPSKTFSDSFLLINKQVNESIK